MTMRGPSRKVDQIGHCSKIIADNVNNYSCITKIHILQLIIKTINHKKNMYNLGSTYGLTVGPKD